MYSAQKNKTGVTKRHQQPASGGSKLETHDVLDVLTVLAKRQRPRRMLAATPLRQCHQFRITSMSGTLHFSRNCRSVHAFWISKLSDESSVKSYARSIKFGLPASCQPVPCARRMEQSGEDKCINLLHPQLHVQPLPSKHTKCQGNVRPMKLTDSLHNFWARCVCGRGTRVKVIVASCDPEIAASANVDDCLPFRVGGLIGCFSRHEALAARQMLRFSQNPC